MSRPRTHNKPELGKCHYCRLKARAKFDCLTCEKLGKKFSIRACDRHRDKAREDSRKHAMVKHPSNLLALGAAALKGEDVW